MLQTVASRFECWQRPECYVAGDEVPSKAQLYPRTLDRDPDALAVREQGCGNGLGALG